MANEDQIEPLTNKRERSPSFPYIDLDAAHESMKQIYRAARMNDVRLADVATAMGMTANSGSFLRYVAALGQFGLIEATGSGEYRRYKVSAQGRRILEDDRPGVKQKLLSDAALQPKIIRGLYLGEDGMPQWGTDRPTDAIAESTLKFDLDFSTEAARRFLTVYDTTIKHIVVEASTTHGLEANREDGLDEVDAPNVNPSPQTEKTVQPTVLPLSSTELNKISFRSEGPGIISISATLDASGLEILEEKIVAFKILLA